MLPAGIGIIALREEERVTEPMPLPLEVLDALRQASTATITTQLFQRGLRNLFLNRLLP